MKYLLTLIFSMLLFYGCGTNSQSGLTNSSLSVDLNIIDINHDRVIQESKQWNLEITIKNSGSIDANGFYVESEVRSGGALISYGETLVETGLSASDVIIINIEMTDMQVNVDSVFTGDVVVDSGFNVRESNEGNNSQSFTITVLDGDDNSGIRVNI